MSILWSRRAGADMIALRAYIAKRDPRAAAGTARRILRSIERLKKFPASGWPGRVPETRELIVPKSPYLVVYRLDQETIEILRVIHAARRWPS